MRIVSNNTNKRVAPLAKKLGLPFTANGCKPLTFGISKAIKIMGVPKKQVAVVGDQIFTDIWGANNAGIRNFLVRPVDPHERFRIRLKRIPEMLILFLYELSCKIGRNRKK